jgi:hypothetical protein
MPPQSTGSFGAAAGGISAELAQAIQRRQTQGGATAQVTQGAATYDPTTQPAASPTGQAPQPQASTVPGQATPDQTQQAATSTLPFDQSELKQIVGALAGRLKVLSGIQQTVVGVPGGQ